MPTNKVTVAKVKEDVTGRLISAFKQLISEGSLIPGSKLPSERKLAESFGVARSSLRQALKVLEIMGVISPRVGGGTYLNKAAVSILSEPMEFLLLLEGISFPELMEARLKESIFSPVPVNWRKILPGAGNFKPSLICTAGSHIP
jgi:DNA-binding FadR family transcriptional regulator